MRMDVLFLMLALCYKGNVFTHTENEIQRGEVIGPTSQSQARILRLVYLILTLHYIILFDFSVVAPIFFKQMP